MSTSDAERSVILVGKPSQNTVNLQKCVICQKEKRSEKPVSTENGRAKLISASKSSDDGLLTGLTGEELENVGYHLKECYKKYILRAERERKDTEKNEKQKSEEYPEISSPVRSKRQKIDEQSKCIICNQTKHKNDRQLYRLSEPSRAQAFLDAIKLNLDEVYTRCSIYQSKEDLYAANLMSHKACMNKYLKQFQRDFKDDQDEEDVKDSKDVQEAFENLLSEIDVEKKGYALSDCRDKLNSHLKNYQVTNRKLKKMLINHFGQEICFTYPRDRQKSQMLLSSNITSTDVVEMLRSTDVVKACAEKLKKECEEFSFGLSDTYLDAHDIELSLKEYEENRPESWTIFFDTLFSYCKRSEHIKRKCDNMFQFVFNIVHNGKEKTPMHISVAQTIHDTCRSKQLVPILNRMEYGISYSELG